MPLRLDDDDTVTRDALVGALQQPVFHLTRQRRCSHIVAQVQRGRHLVDVLAAGALRPYR